MQLRRTVTKGERGGGLLGGGGGGGVCVCVCVCCCTRSKTLLQPHSFIHVLYSPSCFRLFFFYTGKRAKTAADNEGGCDNAERLKARRSKSKAKR